MDKKIENFQKDNQNRFFFAKRFSDGTNKPETRESNSKHKLKPATAASTNVIASRVYS